jgi:hypothetical protein
MIAKDILECVIHAAEEFEQSFLEIIASLAASVIDNRAATAGIGGMHLELVFEFGVGKASARLPGRLGTVRRRSSERDPSKRRPIFESSASR